MQSRVFHFESYVFRVSHQCEIQLEFAVIVVVVLLTFILHLSNILFIMIIITMIIRKDRQTKLRDIKKKRSALI